MKDARWQQIEILFQTALELEPTQRAGFLDEACSGDHTLRSEVESLLETDGREWDLIEGPALEAAAPLLADYEPQLTAGEPIGHYEIDRLIGRGGMGEVYLARDKRLNRKVALKLLPVDQTTDDNRVRRFQQEAQAASALNHPNILTIYELGDVNGQQFIATEFVEGENLRERLRRASLSTTETIDIAIQTLNALAAAHKAGIVHRDIKPENIMVRPDGYVKVLDFGLAKLTEQTERPADVESINGIDISSGVLMGTVKYMSPEQTQGLSVDQRSDIFSLGVVFYEMLVGRAPFDGAATPEVIKSILKDRPSPFAQDPSDPLQQVLDKALAKDKSSRYQSADQMLSALNELVQLKGSALTPTITGLQDRTLSKQQVETRTTSSIEAVVSQITHYKTGVSLGIVMLVMVVLGFTVYALRNRLSKTTTPFERNELVMITRSGEARGGAAISRDGRYLAYSTKSSGQRILWVRNLATNADLKMIAVPVDRGLGNPVFSPDGTYLYYSFTEKVIGSVATSPPSLYRIRVSGGESERILQEVAGPVSFSPDGAQLTFLRGDPSTGVSSLLIANADGTTERVVATRKAPDVFQVNYFTAWSPDGRSIACIGKNASDGYLRVFEVNVETGAQRPLTSRKWNLLYAVAYLPDGRGLLVSAGDTVGERDLWYVSSAGEEPKRITGGGNDLRGVSITADSSALVTSRWEFLADIWIAPDGDATRAMRIAPGRNDFFPSWTPDKRIVFVSRTSGHENLWMMNSDGSERKQLSSTPHDDGNPVVTRDGRYVVFRSNRSGEDRIWRMEISGANPTQLTFGPLENNPECTPDSQFVVYNSWQSGKAAVWKVPVTGGTPVQLTDYACLSPKISPDGSLIACSAGNAQQFIVPISGGKPVKVLNISSPGSFVWSIDGQALLYPYGRNDVINIWAQPLDGSSPKAVTNFTAGQKAATTDAIQFFAWSPDGKQLAFTRSEWKSDVVFIRDVSASN